MSGINISPVTVRLQNASNLASSLFSSRSSGSAGLMSGIYSSLNDYNIMHAGGYSSIVRSYYAKTAEADTDSASEGQKTSRATRRDAIDTIDYRDVWGDRTAAASSADKGKAVKTDAATALSALTSAAKDVSGKADALTSLSYDRAYQKDETGKISYDVDRKAVAQAAQNFVDSYNSMLKSASDVKSDALQNKLYDVESITQGNSSVLYAAGITVNDDQTLSLNTDDLNDASVGFLRKAFSGKSSSVAYIGKAAEELSNLTSTVNSTISNGGSRVYGADGTYDLSLAASSFTDSF